MLTRKDVRLWAAENKGEGVDQHTLSHHSPSSWFTAEKVKENSQVLAFSWGGKELENVLERVGEGAAQGTSFCCASLRTLIRIQHSLDALGLQTEKETWVACYYFRGITV